MCLTEAVSDDAGAECHPMEARWTVLVWRDCRVLVFGKPVESTFPVSVSRIPSSARAA